MTQQERDRLVALKKADKKLITQKQAARRMGVSERQVRRLLGPEHDPGSVLSHDEARRVANDYTIRFRGRLYQIDRKAIVPRRPQSHPQAVESPYRDRPNDQPLRNHRGRRSDVSRDGLP